MKEIICITCPRGCHLLVDEADFSVSGNSCPRGAEYGANELRNPVRTITSTVAVSGSDIRRLPVKTEHPIPKKKLFEAIAEISAIRVSAPVQIGDVVSENIAGTGIKLLATRTVEKGLS